MPLVVKFPFSLIDKLVVPPDWISKEVLVAALVSLRTNDGAVPALVRVKDVGVARPELKVKAMLLPVLELRVLPALYACCKVIPDAFGAQLAN